jgi:hypothetical protein
VFQNLEQAERFLQVVPGDPRTFSDKELEAKYAEFVVNHTCECGGVSGPDDAEFKADAEFPDGCTCGNNGGGDCPWCSYKQIVLDWTAEPGERFVCYYCAKKKAKKEKCNG